MRLSLYFLSLFYGFHAVAVAQDLPPLPGERYDIGGYSLHINCLGEGKPTVIMDVGLGEDSSDWQSLFEQSAQITHTCIYDRAGYGWSDYGPRPRNSRRIAYELGQLLQQAQVPPPYVLVGHSFGGFNLRLFANFYPDRVAGMILIDASHELQYDRLNIKLPAPYKGRRNIIVTQSAKKSPTPDGKHQILRDHAYRAAGQEIAGLYQSSRQVQLNGSIPTVPLIVISRGMPEWSGNEKLRRREKIWIELQQDLTRLSPYSQHIFANQSGHDIPHEQPQIIVDAITDIINMAKLIESP
ncbi:MAG: alpha/beta hydrolase [Methylophaga sp.]|nr:MAG: alpha/beta hydrolase [Methylophaga sp.]